MANSASGKKIQVIRITFVQLKSPVSEKFKTKFQSVVNSKHKKIKLVLHSFMKLRIFPAFKKFSKYQIKESWCLYVAWNVSFCIRLFIHEQKKESVFPFFKMPHLYWTFEIWIINSRHTLSDTLSKVCQWDFVTNPKWHMSDVSFKILLGSCVFGFVLNPLSLEIIFIIKQITQTNSLKLNF